jgi:hypothetical protein
MVYRTPSVGEQLRTLVTQLNDLGSMTVIRGDTFSGEELVASCEMKVFLSDAQ